MLLHAPNLNQHLLLSKLLPNSCLYLAHLHIMLNLENPPQQSFLFLVRLTQFLQLFIVLSLVEFLLFLLVDEVVLLELVFAVARFRPFEVFTFA